MAKSRYGDAVDVQHVADLYAPDWTLRRIGMELGVNGARSVISWNARG
jgi:hypothetical protein